MKNYVKTLVYGFLLTFLLVGCSSEEPAEVNANKESTGTSQANENVNEEANEITFTDTTGKEITLSLPVTKAVVINRNTAEAITLLGAQDAIIATGDNTIKNNGYLGLNDLPDVGKTDELNIESILSLKPEVVFTFTNRPDNTLEEKLEPVGIKVVRLNNYLADQMDEELRILAKIFGKEDRAEEYITWKQNIEQILTQRTKDIPTDQKKSVLALSAGALNTNGKYNIYPTATLDGQAGPGEGFATILAGGIDPTPDILWESTKSSTTVNVEEEFVLTANPDVITLHGNFFGGYDAKDATSFTGLLDNVVTNTAVSQMTAGKNKDVYMFYTNFFGSDKGFIGRLQLGKYLYPDRFEDIIVEDYIKEYFENWLGVTASGIWFHGAK
ncbi:ABC transporter substrate-binding protein [Solibacillus cecembensis]|uniref:ABC transporter substrate-binding protein n=1 Tax=Solibacillus cecembensis TaxID=459347 RepID=UPI003D0780DF